MVLLFCPAPLCLLPFPQGWRELPLRRRPRFPSQAQKDNFALQKQVVYAQTFFFSFAFQVFQQVHGASLKNETDILLMAEVEWGLGVLTKGTWENRLQLSQRASEGKQCLFGKGSSSLPKCCLLVYFIYKSEHSVIDQEASGYRSVQWPRNKHSLWGVSGRDKDELEAVLCTSVRFYFWKREMFIYI